MKNLLFTVMMIQISINSVLANSNMHQVIKAGKPIVIDGVKDKAWGQGAWQPLNHLIVGVQPDKNDFSGRYKLLWDEHYLYLFAEIVDDVLYDKTANPLVKYWDDDCLEVFIDEDNSGGDHLYNFNAFAYHVALDNQSVDIGRKSSDGDIEVLLLNEHIKSQWRRSFDNPRKIHWELAIKLFDDTFNPDVKNNEHVRLKEHKTIGFMLAYCDNDGSEFRESFVGSHAIKAVNGDKNLGYKTADVFGKIVLIK